MLVSVLNFPRLSVNSHKNTYGYTAVAVSFIHLLPDLRIY